MKSLRPNENNLRPNGQPCGASGVNDKRLALLEEQISQAQEDISLLDKTIKDFGSSFSTASASITKLTNDSLVSNKADIKELFAGKISAKEIAKQYSLIKTSDVSIPLGSFKTGEMDIVVKDGETIQYIKTSVVGNTIFTRSNSDAVINSFTVTKSPERSGLTLKNNTGREIQVLYFVDANDYKAEAISGQTEEVTVGDFTTVSGAINISSDTPIYFKNATIDNLTVNELNALDLVDTIRASAQDLHADAATILDAIIDVLKANQIDTTELHAVNGVVDTLNVTNLNVDATCSAGDINSTGDITAVNLNLLEGLRVENIKMDKKIQLPVITNVDYTDIEMPIFSGIVVGTIVDDNTKERLADFTVIKNTTVNSNIFFSYSEKEVNDLLSIHEDEDKDFILRTKLSGKTLYYGTLTNEDTPTFEVVVNSQRVMKLNATLVKRQHFIILGNKTPDYGLEILGEMKAALIPLPGTSAFEDLAVSNSLSVGGPSSFNGIYNNTTLVNEGTADFKDNVTIGTEDKNANLIVRGTSDLKGNVTVGEEGNPADLVVNGNIIQNGSSYETHTEQVYTKKDMIITREGAMQGLGEYGLTGIQAFKYDDVDNGILAFDKTGTARVGDEGFEVGEDGQPLIDPETGKKIFRAQAIATRDEEEKMVGGNAVAWDSVNKKLITPKSVTVDGHLLARTDDALMLYGAEGMDNIPENSSLDDLVKCGQYSADDGLANTITERPAGEAGAFDLIVGYFNTDKSQPYQIYTGKTSKKIFHRNTVDGAYETTWQQIANAADGSVSKVANNAVMVKSDGSEEILATKDQPAYEYKDIYRAKYDDNHYDNVEEMITYLTTTGGFATGSAIIVDGGPSNEPNSWFTYTWLPHRNGKPKGDNKDYGTLTLNLMSSSSYIVATGGGKWEYYYENGNIYGPFDILRNTNIKYPYLLNFAAPPSSKGKYILLKEVDMSSIYTADTQPAFDIQGQIGSLASGDKIFIRFTGDYRFGVSTSLLFGYYFKHYSSQSLAGIPDIRVYVDGDIVRYYMYLRDDYSCISVASSSKLGRKIVDTPIGTYKYSAFDTGDKEHRSRTYNLASTESALPYNIAGAGDYRPPKNLDDAPVGASIYEFTYYGDCINKPWFDTYFGGTVLTFKDYHNDINSYTQIYISQKTSPEGGNLIGFRRRELNGAWTAWDQIVTGNMISYKPLNLQFKDIGLTNNTAASVKDLCLNLYKKGYKAGDILHFAYWYEGTGQITGAGITTEYLASGIVQILNLWKDGNENYWFISQITGVEGNVYIGKWAGKANEEGTTYLRKLS